MDFELIVIGLGCERASCGYIGVEGSAGLGFRARVPASMNGEYAGHPVSNEYGPG